MALESARLADDPSPSVKLSLGAVWWVTVWRPLTVDRAGNWAPDRPYKQLCADRRVVFVLRQVMSWRCISESSHSWNGKKRSVLVATHKQLQCGWSWSQRHLAKCWGLCLDNGKEWLYSTFLVSPIISLVGIPFWTNRCSFFNVALDHADTHAHTEISLCVSLLRGLCKYICTIFVSFKGFLNALDYIRFLNLTRIRIYFHFIARVFQTK